MLTSKLLVLITEVFVLGATVDAFHTMQVPDHRACTKIYTLPESEKYVELFSNYLIESHEEKLKATEAVKERKQAEIEALTKILAYQKFISKYLVEAHEAKLEAVRVAEAALVERYEAELTMFEQQVLLDTNTCMEDSVTRGSQVLSSSISSESSQKDYVANKIQENLLSASTSIPFTLELEKESDIANESSNKFAQTPEEDGRQKLVETFSQKVVDKNILDVDPDEMSVGKRIENPCTSIAVEKEGENSNSLLASGVQQPSPRVLLDRNTMVSNGGEEEKKQVMVETDSQNLDDNNSANNPCPSIVGDKEAEKPDSPPVSGVQQPPSTVSLDSNSMVSNGREEERKQIMVETDSQKVDNNNSVPANSANDMPNKPLAKETIENDILDEMEERKRQGFDRVLSSRSQQPFLANTPYKSVESDDVSEETERTIRVEHVLEKVDIATVIPDELLAQEEIENVVSTNVEERETQNFDPVSSSMSTKPTSTESEDAVAATAFFLFCFPFLAYLWENFFQ